VENFCFFTVGGGGGGGGGGQGLGGRERFYNCAMVGRLKVSFWGAPVGEKKKVFFSFGGGRFRALTRETLSGLNYVGDFVRKFPNTQKRGPHSRGGGGKPGRPFFWPPGGLGCGRGGGGGGQGLDCHCPLGRGRGI